MAWSLEQTKYFTQGCPSLIVVTNHKPLVKILSDRKLDEITNDRIFRLKQRTLPWSFKIHHMRGKTNLAAEATSRYPSAATIGLLTSEDHMEDAINVAIRKRLQKLQYWVRSVHRNSQGSIALSSIETHPIRF